MEVESHDEADHVPACGAIESVFIKEEVVEGEKPDEVSSCAEAGLRNSSSLYVYHAELLAYFLIT
jgi:hypothetical protein